MNQRKIASVEELKQLLQRAKNVAVVDYTGMTVAQATELRKAVKASGGLMKVTKNTLFKIAAGKPELPLSGLSAFIFSLADEISALKQVKLPFKLGLAGDRVLTAAEVAQLAATPARETSVARLMFLLQYYTSRFVRTLDAIAKKEVK
mgnify:FL=1